jgi:hypothetical protein
MTIVCVGHSHLGAISKGARVLGTEITALRLRENKKDKRSTDERWVAVRDGIRALKPDRLYCFVGGGMPAILGVAQHPIRFDFALPWRPDLAPAPDAQGIPYDAMRALMTARVRKHFQSLTKLKRFRLPMMQFESPPPIFDNAVVARMSGSYANEAGSPKGEAALGISDPYLRYKLWSLHSRVFEDFCTQNDIAYVKNPPAALDEKGFLAPAYWGDFVHGNADYGALVLRNLGSA